VASPEKERRRGSGRWLLIALAILLPCGAAWWLQRDRDLALSATEAEKFRLDVLAEIEALPSPRGEARSRWRLPAQRARYRLDIEMVDASASAAAVTGIPDDALENGIERRNTSYQLTLSPRAAALELLLRAQDGEEPRANFLVDPLSAEIRFDPTLSPQPAAGPRDAQTWLREEIGLLWITTPGLPLADHERIALPPRIETFKSGQLRDALQVSIRSHDRLAGGLWFDENDRAELLAYQAAVLDGEQWQGRQEIVVRGRLSGRPGLEGLSGEWSCESRLRLRRDTSTIATADHRILTMQRIVRESDNERPDEGR
jgi:hypothetical protein